MEIKWKMEVGATKMYILMVQTKRKLEEEVNTKI